MKRDDGPMGIAANFIQHNVDICAPVLLKVFNDILRAGVVPSEWKMSFLTPRQRNAIRCAETVLRIAYIETLPTHRCNDTVL